MQIDDLNPFHEGRSKSKFLECKHHIGPLHLIEKVVENFFGAYLLTGMH